MKNLVDIGNQYKDNESIGALVAGGLIDAAKTTINTGLENQYNDSFLGSLATYNKTLDDSKTGNTKGLMATEAGLTKEVIQKNADESIRLGQAGYGSTGYMTQAEVAKQGAVNTGMLDVARENRLGSDFAEVARGQTARDVASTQASGARDVARENRLGSDFAEVTRGQTARDVASTQASGARDVASTQASGARDVATIQGDYNVRNTTETGRQSRLLEGEKTDQQMRLRADARGAIRSAGGRFYG
jgi:hypothetical protein